MSTIKQSELLMEDQLIGTTSALTCLRPRTHISRLMALKSFGTAWVKPDAWPPSWASQISLVNEKQYSASGLPDWPFHGQFRKIWPFLTALAMKKRHLAILQNLAIFSVCHCKIKFPLNILSFCIFWTVFISLIVAVTPWHFDLLLLWSV